MKILIKSIALFCVVVVLWSQAIAQTNNPLRFKRCSYEEDKKEYEIKKLKFLPENSYPWGVCLPKNANFSTNEIKWIFVAIRSWNTYYSGQKLRMWDNFNVIGIPSHPLFVPSCDTSRHNILWIVKRPLKPDVCLCSISKGVFFW